MVMHSGTCQLDELPGCHWETSNTSRNGSSYTMLYPVIQPKVILPRRHYGWINRKRVYEVVVTSTDVYIYMYVYVCIYIYMWWFPQIGVPPIHPF